MQFRGPKISQDINRSTKKTINLDEESNTVYECCETSSSQSNHNEKTTKHHNTNSEWQKLGLVEPNITVNELGSPDQCSQL